MESHLAEFAELRQDDFFPPDSQHPAQYSRFLCVVFGDPILYGKAVHAQKRLIHPKIFQ